MHENDISKIVVDASYKIHTKLGPGLLESAYQVILAYELKNSGLRIETEVTMPVVYENLNLDIGFRADMVVEDLVILELKSVETVADVHKKQLLTYLRASGKRLGLLINFGAPIIRQGITRIVNGLEEKNLTR
jgi:GxxExxY protein